MGSGTSPCKAGWAQKAWNLPAAFLTRGRVGFGAQPFRKFPELSRREEKMFQWSQENLGVDVFASWCSPPADLPAGTIPPSPCRSGSGSWDRPADAPKELLRQSEPSPSRGDTRWDPAQGLGLTPSASSWAGNEQLVRSRAGIRIQIGQQSNRKW